MIPMLEDAKVKKLKDLRKDGMSIHKISETLKLDRKTVRRHLKEDGADVPEAGTTGTAENSVDRDAEIRKIELKERNTLIGKAKGETVASRYLKFADEIDQELGSRLIDLRSQYNSYLTEHNVDFGTLIERALKEYVEKNANKRTWEDLEKLLEYSLAFKALDML